MFDSAVGRFHILRSDVSFAHGGHAQKKSDPTPTKPGKGIWSKKYRQWGSGRPTSGERWRRQLKSRVVCG